MMKRPTMTALAVSAALLAAVGATVTGAQAAKAAKKPSIGSASISPRSLPGSGGSVSVKVSIKSNGASVTSVTARSTLSGTGSPGISATLSSSNGKSYAGSVRVPGNSLTRKTTAYIYVDVQSSAGLVSKKVGTISIAPGDPNQPPPPPPI